MIGCSSSFSVSNNWCRLLVKLVLVSICCSEFVVCRFRKLVKVVVQLVLLMFSFSVVDVRVCSGWVGLGVVSMFCVSDFSCDQRCERISGLLLMKVIGFLILKVFIEMNGKWCCDWLLLVCRWFVMVCWLCGFMIMKCSGLMLLQMIFQCVLCDSSFMVCVSQLFSSVIRVVLLVVLMKFLCVGILLKQLILMGVLVVFIVQFLQLWIEFVIVFVLLVCQWVQWLVLVLGFVLGQVLVFLVCCQ